MSLLMDALKRAEEAKRQSAALGPATQPAPRAPAPPKPAEPSPPSALSLEPIADEALPKLAEHQAEVDADLREAARDGDLDLVAATPPATARPAPRPSPAPAARPQAEATPPLGSEQAAARNVFNAKSGEAAGNAKGVRLALIIGCGFLAAIGVGTYFYLQLQQVSGTGLRPGVAAPSRPVPITPPAAAAPAPGVASAATTPSPSAAPGSPAAAVAAPATQVAVAPEAAKSATPAANPVSPRTPASRGVALPAAAGSEAAPDSPIRVTSGTARQNPSIVRAYQALQAGDLETARSAYEQALRSDPRNADTLTGLATLAARTGDSDKALEYFGRALEADPKNAAAIAGAVALRPGGDTAQTESRLKATLAAQAPGSTQAAMIHFALGNIYSGQKRWNEAQSAYFNAYSADSDNPDYHYNLAVSLDHLQQTRLAVQFYQSALQAANARPGAFDRAQAKNRLDELQR